jgi:hypothetical protein
MLRAAALGRARARDARAVVPPRLEAMRVRACGSSVSVPRQDQASSRSIDHSDRGLAVGRDDGHGDARSRADLRHGPKVASLSGERDEPAFRIGRSQLRGELSLAHVGRLAAPHQCRASSHEFGLRPRSAEERCWSISIRVPISIGPSVRLRSGCWIIKTPDLGLRARVGRQGHRGEYGPTTGWRAALLRHAARQINLTSGDRQSSLTA